MQVFTAAEKKMNRIITAVSIAVPIVVAVLFYTPAVQLSLDVSRLPAFHALLNGTVSVLLVVGFLFIRRKMVWAHRASMMGAFVLSAVFLVSYVVYHAASESTPYGGEGFVRNIYYVILISHILLATIILPLVMFTIYRAISGRLEQHRKLARWTFPIWLYVSVTGVIVYLMISPYYG
jgi:putative membrane protein